MKTPRSLAFPFAVLALVTGLAPAAAAPPGSERFVVPLSRPGRPVKVVAGLLNGSITVRGHDAAEVWIEARGGHDEADVPRRRDGMTRIPNRSLGLTVDEEDNEVRIGMGAGSATGLLVHVPRDATLVLSTVNEGDIVVEDVHGALDLRNTNGDVRARGISGAVSATTVNGDVDVVFDRVRPDGAMAFTTLNGDVTVTLPADFAATLRLRSDNGEIFSDFDVDVQNPPGRLHEGRPAGRHRLEMEREVVAAINGGGTELHLKTFNGDILVRKHR